MSSRPAPSDCRHEPPYGLPGEVVFAISAPDLTCHRLCDACRLEEPHQTAVCGLWRVSWRRRAVLRLVAIGRCLYHALEPPAIERWRVGSCHYQDGFAEPWSYREHAAANLRQAWRLARFLPLDPEERNFHGLPP